MLPRRYVSPYMVSRNKLYIYDKTVCILSNKTEQDLLFYICVVFPKINVCVKVKPITCSPEDMCLHIWFAGANCTLVIKMLAPQAI